jgi:hypothetical protein
VPKKILQKPPVFEGFFRKVPIRLLKGQAYNCPEKNPERSGYCLSIFLALKI